MRGTRNRTITIADQKIVPGETKDIKLKFSESYLGTAVTVPIRVIRAKDPGPRVFITGTIHGDEITGIGIIRNLLYERPPELKRGTLVCVPAVNIYGLEHNSRYLPDRRDLNRCFPGSPDGSPSSRLAYDIFNQVVRGSDWGIDFHTAAIRRTNYPNVRAEMRGQGVRDLARAFGCELIVDSKGPEGSLRRMAVKSGIPCIILEAGEVWKIEPGVSEIGLRGCLNVLKWLGMIDGEPELPLFQITIEKTQWVRAEKGGFLGFHAKPGDLVQRGQPLATNYTVFGRERSYLTSPTQGIVLGMSTMPAVKPGEPIYNVASLPPKTFDRIRRRIAESSDESLFRRIQVDLSTNITVQDR